MNTKRAKPGDMVHITNPDFDTYDKTCRVIETPEGFNTGCLASKTWVLYVNFDGLGKTMWLRTSDYTIVCRAEPQSPDGDVDAFLKKQLNDNLRGVFV